MPAREHSTLRIVLQPIAIGIALALAVRFLALDAYSIPSASMSPTLEVGDHILVTPFDLPLFASEPQRGDVIVFRRNTEGYLVKRIVGLPNETIEIRDGTVRVDGHTLPEPYLQPGQSSGLLAQQRLPGDSYFVMGDARDNSLDSRSWGAVGRSAIVGKARVIFWSAGGSESARTARAQTSSSAPAARAGTIRWDRILRSVR